MARQALVNLESRQTHREKINANFVEVYDAIAGKADASHVHAFSSITGKPTTLAGYGITDAQPADADLTAYANAADAAARRVLLGLGNVENAAASTLYVGLTGAQTVAGVKTFSSAIVADGVRVINPNNSQEAALGWAFGSTYAIAPIFYIGASSANQLKTNGSYIEIYSGNNGYGTVFNGAGGAKIGINTTEPTAWLEVRNNSGSALFAVADGSTQITGDLTISRSGSPADATLKLINNAGEVHISSDTSRNLQLTDITAAGTNRLYIRASNGNVGIGNYYAGNEPAEKLTVSGNLAAENGTFSGPLKPGVYTFGTLPSASACGRAIVAISDRGNKLAHSDGTDWRFVYDNSVVS